MDQVVEGFWSTKVNTYSWPKICAKNVWTIGWSSFYL